MDIADEVIDIEYDELESINIPLDKLVELCVRHNNVKYEFIMKLKSDSDKLIVLGSGTATADKKSMDRPFFNRWRWKYNDSFICYNDPTLYLDEEILGGWGVGEEDEYYLEYIKNILLILTKKLNILNENILFYGSSMGGFMSMQLASMVKDSIALAEIPQFDLKYWDDYWDELNHWDLIKRHCFNNKTTEEIYNEYGYRVNIVEMMKKENYIPKAIIIMDFSERRDVDMAYLNFFKQLREFPFNDENNKNKIKIIINGRNKGHSVIEKEEILSLIDGILNRNLMTLNEDIESSQLFLENQKLKKDYADLQKKYSEITSSNSWKITKPLRNIKNSVKK